MPTRKAITLPSGATCVIRKLTGFDCLSIGFVPNALPNGKPATASKDKKADLETQERLTIAGLTRCVSPLKFPDGRRLKIVNKEMDEAAEGEITIGELDDADAVSLIHELTALSGLTREAGQSAAPFPEEPEATDPGASGGQAVLEAPVGDSGTAN